MKIVKRAKFLNKTGRGTNVDHGTAIVNQENQWRGDRSILARLVLMRRAWISVARAADFRADLTA